MSSVALMFGENEDSYILLHLTKKHLHCLQDIVVATADHSCAEKMTDILQLTESGNMLVHQWSWEGPEQYDMTSYCLDNCLGFCENKKGVNGFGVNGVFIIE